ncbi:GTP cyclohydrolase II [bacterium endosymbiont of Pedicinus badii]|uniref:GTP cyclohydrolase II n=1 Tax=bacterium endosymbiont of Pedicinus badii TaxID=1719126 RepID=UPI0009BA7100|nr:GTP cyclohydrolase II [bacterium endosymbiont of Pedicinus badii]OQM34405.1 GTP cyclohydrolase [bacterium endosymbiont of Pedicinus badii]
MQIKYIKKANLPTLWGNFLIFGFEEIKNKNNHIALVLGKVQNKEKILTRIHSECLTGDSLFSLRCDCGFQLKESLKRIAKNKKGVLIYHRQEGRGIGLLNKIRAYSLQDEKGMDTVEANYKLGFSADERNFTICAEIINFLKIKSINLLTNNPEKLEFLKNFGIIVNKRIPLVVGINPKNKQYLKTKEKKMGHIL